MKRRFLPLAFLALASIRIARASAPDQQSEGRSYVVLQTRQSVRDARQVEVLEFFAYSCGHCNAFEPVIDAWQKKLPRDVMFRRIPVAFRDDFVIHQKLYFAIEAMGLVEQLHPKVFVAIHVDRKKLNTRDEIGAFIVANGGDRAQFFQVLDSFGVAAKVKQANALASGYAIEGTPSIGVNGRWLTSGSLAGSNPKSLSVAEYLIGLARKDG